MGGFGGGTHLGGMGAGDFAGSEHLGGLGGVGAGARFAGGGIDHLGGGGHISGFHPGLHHHHYLGYGFYPEGGIYDDFYGASDCYDWSNLHPGKPLPLNCS